MKDWFVDGHYIGAVSAEAARAEAASLYGFTPEVIRPWTDADDAPDDDPDCPEYMADGTCIHSDCAMRYGF